MPQETRFGLSFGTDVSPDTEGELSHTVEADTVIREITVRFYGSATLLNLNPVVKGRHGNRVSLIKTLGQQHIDGDDDTFTFRVDEEVKVDDEIIIEYENTDTEYEHQFRVNMNLEEDSEAWF